MRITGAAFTAEIGSRRIRFWLAYESRKRTIEVSDLRSVRIQPNGYTKLVLRLRKDLLVPTSHHEATQLVKTLNALLSERRATAQRRREAGREYRRKYEAQVNKNEAMRRPLLRPRGLPRTG